MFIHCMHLSGEGLNSLYGTSDDMAWHICAIPSCHVQTGYFSAGRGDSLTCNPSPFTCQMCLPKHPNCTI